MVVIGVWPVCDFVRLSAVLLLRATTYLCKWKTNALYAVGICLVHILLSVDEGAPVRDCHGRNVSACHGLTIWVIVEFSFRRG
jgi:hypothetical protein